MCPIAGRFVNGAGRAPSLFQRGHMVCHVLLVETERDGLILVDTGIGAQDVEDPRRLPTGFVGVVGARLDPAEPAVAQVRALGFAPDDVRHLIATHLDVDHAGGIPDFPAAQVHVHRAEYDGAMRRPTRMDRARYVPVQWQHGPRWSTYDERDGGDTWLGVPAVRTLRGVSADVVIVPTPGHTRGHIAVAVRQGERWLVHAGDAYFFHGEMAPAPSCPPGLKLFQRIDEVDRQARLESQARLRTLAQRADVDIFCAHDPEELDRYAPAPAHAHARGATA
jgi:glyoxylase-like metal-dependent hydrolase (beta-lactamase superfamily II)